MTREEQRAEKARKEKELKDAKELRRQEKQEQVSWEWTVNMCKAKGAWIEC